MNLRKGTLADYISKGKGMDSNLLQMTWIHISKLPLWIASVRAALYLVSEE